MRKLKRSATRFLIPLFLAPVCAWAVWDYDSVCLNNWRCPITNYGNFGNNPVTGTTGGYWLGHPYIFGAGIWVGSIVNGETLVAVGYNPNSGKSEFSPTLEQYYEGGYTDPRDRVYRYPGDWPPSRSRFPMAPDTVISDMDLWACCTDADTLNLEHDSLGRRSMDVDLFLSVYAFPDSFARDMFFLKYAVVNNRDSNLTQVRVGVVMDGDIGNAGNDYAGFIHDRLFGQGADTFRVKNAGYEYSGAENGWRPGAVAVRQLFASDSTGITSFKIFTLQAGDPMGNAHQYQALAGYDWWVTPPTYDPYDSLDYAAADKRFLMASAPCEIAAHSADTFWYAVIGSPYDSVFPARDTTDLALRCDWAERLWRSGAVGTGEASFSLRSPVITYVGPSPFRAGQPLTIAARKPEPTEVRIYDTRGVLVRALKGRTPLTWDGNDARCRRLASGVYFVEVTQGRCTQSAKVQLLRD